MSRRDWGTGFAIGLITALVISLLLLVVAVPGFRDPTYNQERQEYAQDDQDGQHNPIIPPGFLSHYATPQDTYAQWIMAGLSIVATAFSIWAVLLVRSTLQATRDSVLETRRTGQAQVRAYLSVTGGRYSVGTGSARYDIAITNVGQSPATNVVAICIIDLVGRPGPNREYTSWKSSIAAISSSGEDKVWFFYNIPPDPDFWGTTPSENYPQISEDRARLLREETFKHSSIRVTVGWDDVFGRRQIQSFFLHEISSERSFADDGTTIRRDGELSAGRTQHYQDDVKIPKS